MKIVNGKSKWLKEGDLRLDASFHLSEGRVAKLKTEKSPFGTKALKDLTEAIFNGARFKRYYVKDPSKGVPFMGSTDMLKSDLNNLKLISKKLSRNMDSLFLDTGWTLVSCSGTIGNTVYTHEDFKGKTASQHIMRIIPNNKILSGYLYAFLSSQLGYALLTQGTYGAVIQHIEPHHIEDLPIPFLPEAKQKEIHELIVEAAELRVEANRLLNSMREKLKQQANLPPLNVDEYEYFGNHTANRRASTFTRNIKEINALSINAFNYSKKVEILENRVKTNEYLKLKDCLNADQFFSSGAFKRVELDSPSSIRLINQSDIFQIEKKGKKLAKRFVKADKLVEYGEVLIAGVGTLGENETFCRTIFANEELEGQLISGEFIRMNTNKRVPSGYLFCWLSTDYGFRFIRKTQAGTKLCRPIQELLKDIPVPILQTEDMKDIDINVKKAHTLLWDALCKEKEAIHQIEKEIDTWQN